MNPYLALSLIGIGSEMSRFPDRPLLLLNQIGSEESNLGRTHTAVGIRKNEAFFYFYSSLTRDGSSF